MTITSKTRSVIRHDATKPDDTLRVYLTTGDESLLIEECVTVEGARATIKCVKEAKVIRVTSVDW